MICAVPSVGAFGAVLTELSLAKARVTTLRQQTFFVADTFCRRSTAAIGANTRGFTVKVFRAGNDGHTC